MLKVVDLFSGIGGFSLAAKWAGCETVLFVENDKFCQKILKKRFPKVPILGDIKDVTEEQLRELGEVDIVTSGTPCQSVSQAGRRKGTNDDRYLWPEMFRIIKILKPTWVIGENVTGLTTMVEYSSGSELAGKTYNTQEEAEASFKEVYREGQGLLENILGEFGEIGYEVQPMLIPASSVGAKHKRERIWIIAYSDEYGQRRSEEKRRSYIEEKRISDFDRQEDYTTRMPVGTDVSEISGSGEIQEYVFDPTSEGLPRWAGGSVGEPFPLTEFERRNDETNDADTELSGYSEGMQPEATSKHVSKNRQFEYDFRGVAYGVSDRVDRLKALGNAIVPEVAYEIFKGIVNESRTAGLG